MNTGTEVTVLAVPLRAEPAAILRKLAEWHRGGGAEPPFTPGEMAGACDAGADALEAARAARRPPLKDRVKQKKRKLKGGGR